MKKSQKIFFFEKGTLEIHFEIFYQKKNSCTVSYPCLGMARGEVADRG
jgi:hypothetical protein